MGRFSVELRRLRGNLIEKKTTIKRSVTQAGRDVLSRWGYAKDRKAQLYGWRLNV